MRFLKLGIAQKVVLTVWLLGPPLYAYWRGAHRWAIYDLTDEAIQGAFISDMIWAYLVGAAFTALLLLIWKRDN